MKRPYIYIRMDEQLIERIKVLAKTNGSNMTVWARQNLIKCIEKAEKNRD